MGRPSLACPLQRAQRNDRWSSAGTTTPSPATPQCAATSATPQDLRRFLVGLCGADFRFDRAFMAWIGDGAAKPLGEVADERRRRHADTSPSA
ncbi:DUF6434 domain-containing protein [Pseudomonas aeruginosa]|uniref:DUF6434 domain-containing protein n=1 Tax=Pseudomonas aeruginosa TaxID=287 RepID=UPI0028A1CD07|nr:DUF6434 domain-containing protein [Pseudomonas aeruginosa]